MALFKDTVIKLLDKYEIKYTKVRYFRRSPYQAHRYKPEYVGEEVWIYGADVLPIMINSIDSADEDGSVEGFIKSLFL